MNFWKLLNSLPGGWRNILATIAPPPRNDGTSAFSLGNLSEKSLASRWVVSAEQGGDLLLQGAILLDVRKFTWLRKKLPGAVKISWQDFAKKESGQGGKLLEDTKVLAQKLQDLGISQGQPVVVVGDPLGGWGEEGRIVWMLRSLGHEYSVFVDGGASALGRRKVIPSPQGDFNIQYQQQWQVGKEEFRASLAQEQTVILDSRETREYRGATPYGEQRGGHVPGAVHLYYRELLTPVGKLRGREEIKQLLADKGITPDKEILCYCTGGVRSAWLTAVLVDLGFRAKNYPGSMWEWSSLPAATHPLQAR